MKAGDEITVVVVTPVATTEEKGIVQHIEGDNIYVEGLDIPFNTKTGDKTDVFPGARVYIKELKKNK